jgi:hypothetical protein
MSASNEPTADVYDALLDRLARVRGAIAPLESAPEADESTVVEMEASTER